MHTCRLIIWSRRLDYLRSLKADICLYMLSRRLLCGLDSSEGDA